MIIEPVDAELQAAILSAIEVSTTTALVGMCIIAQFLRGLHGNIFLTPWQRPRRSKIPFGEITVSTTPSISPATGGKERRARKAKVILNRNNAQEILKALRDLEERRPEFATRWLWELMQNARDFPEPARPMIVRVRVTPGQISFSHNGRDFSEDEILSLIYHGSTKQDQSLLGKFGTGFLSTHLLSRKVRVRGTLVEETGDEHGFEFALDRSGDDAASVGEAMDRSVDAFERSLSDTQIGPSEWTEYIYDARRRCADER